MILKLGGVYKDILSTNRNLTFPWNIHKMVGIYSYQREGDFSTVSALGAKGGSIKHVGQDVWRPKNG